MASDTFASRMREAAKRLSKFRARELADEMGVQTYREYKSVRDAIRDFMKRGEFKRVARGLYEYVPQKKKRTKLDVIWHLVRSHRHFGIDEMERLSGAARDTVKEYLSCLVRAGYLRKASRTRWLLVNDPGPDTPVNTAKCERLKRRRSKGRKVESQRVAGHGG